MYIIESDVAMVGLVVLVMLWDKYLRHRIEMTKLKQGQISNTKSIISNEILTEDDVVEIIQNQLPEEKGIKIFE